MHDDKGLGHLPTHVNPLWHLALPEVRSFPRRGNTLWRVSIPNLIIEGKGLSTEFEVTLWDILLLLLLDRLGGLSLVSRSVGYLSVTCSCEAVWAYLPSYLQLR
jgi:hypothetical protein